MIQKVIFKKLFYYFILLFGMISLLSACGDKQKEIDLQQAFSTHGEAVKVRKNAQEALIKLQANTDSLFVANNSEELKSIAEALALWDEQLVEVPGFEHDHSHHDHSGHDHDHDHDHNHDHNHSGQELTPKQHIEVQQHLLSEIKAIVEKISSIK